MRLVSKRKPTTEMQKAYKKELKRVKAYIQRKEKQGILISEAVLPKTPKRITQASVRRLERLTSKRLLSKAKYIDIETGKQISAKAYKEKQKERANQKRKETREANKRKREKEKELEQYRREIDEAIRRNRDELNKRHQISYTEEYSYKEQYDEPFPSPSDVALQNWDNEISRYPKMLYPILREWTDDLISQVGREAVAEMIIEGRANGLVISYSIAYDESKIMQFASNMMKYLPNINEYLSNEEMAQIIDELGDWEEY